MNVEYFYHRHSNLLIEHDANFKINFEELNLVLKEISDDDLIERFLLEKKSKPSTKSLASSINALLKERLKESGWLDEVGLFKEPPYTNKNKSRWRLDFAKNNISVEVAFNHQEATAHNIMKPVLASELNHVKKEVQTRLGVIIVATKKMKACGNFDGAIGTFESFQEYFKPYNSIITTPIVLIGLNSPETFQIERITKKIIYYGEANGE